MAAGQEAFSVAADAAALRALELRLVVQEAERGARHAEQLRTVLELHAVYTAAGMEISTVPHAALALGCSEHRATRLLDEGRLLAALPGGVEAVACGLLTVEQATTVVERLSPLALPTRLAVWRRLQERLLAAAESGSVLPPARLAELLRRWVIAADPTDAQQRRQRAEDGRGLDYRRRADGLGDLFAYGFRGPDLQAVLSRINARSAPVGPADDRTADQRRFDAARDLLLGRDPLPLHAPGCGGDLDDASAGTGPAACGCRPGSPSPCGAQLLVHLTLDSALGTSDEAAELVGHGPLEPDVLVDLLLASPVLRPVWTVDGVPVAVGGQVLVPTGTMRRASARPCCASLRCRRPMSCTHGIQKTTHHPPDLPQRSLTGPRPRPGNRWRSRQARCLCCAAPRSVTRHRLQPQSRSLRPR